MNGAVETSDKSRRIKEFTTNVLRRIRKIEYKNVQNVPGYETTEKEYISLRNSLEDANDMIKELINYEHGNKYIKMIKNGIETLSDKSTLNIYKSKDMFEELSAITRKMSMMKLDVESKNVSEKMCVAYKKLSESKKALNDKLECIRQQLKEKRNQCLEINKNRKKLKNMRFDLEVLLQDGGYNNEIREAEKKEFNSSSSQVLKMMIQFTEDASIASILKSISKEYFNHLKETAEILQKTQ